MTTQPTLSDLAKSYVRTVVPVIVGLIVSLALRAGLNVSGYTPEITSAVTFGYYAVARGLEHYVDPRFGWLLGLASKPVYAKPKPGPKPVKKSTRPVAKKAAGYGAIDALVAVVFALLIVFLVLVVVHHVR